jgi:hypothetical protein
MFDLSLDWRTICIQWPMCYLQCWVGILMGAWYRDSYWSWNPKTNQIGINVNLALILLWYLITHVVVLILLWYLISHVVVWWYPGENGTPKPWRSYLVLFFFVAAMMVNTKTDRLCCKSGLSTFLLSIGFVSMHFHSWQLYWHCHVHPETIASGKAKLPDLVQFKPA